VLSLHTYSCRPVVILSSYRGRRDTITVDVGRTGYGEKSKGEHI
jgi:hypothetical protein